MRPDQSSPVDSGKVEGNVGINSLPQYGDTGNFNPNDYEPLNLNDKIPTPPAVPIPKAEPVVPTNDWRNSAGSYRTFYPAPGTPSSTPPQQDQPGFFARLLNSIIGGTETLGKDVIGGAGGLLDRLRGLPGAPPDKPAPKPRSVPSLSSIYNMGRSAFSSTLPQLEFPGSNIGPTSGLVNNPYAAGLMKPSGFHDTSIPGGAAAFSNSVRASNII